MKKLKWNDKHYKNWKGEKIYWKSLARKFEIYPSVNGKIGFILEHENTIVHIFKKLSSAKKVAQLIHNG